MPRGDGAPTLNTFVCPFVDRCDCRVKFRIFASDDKIQLETQGEHTPESHINDKVSKFLTHRQSAAIDSVVSTMPMTNATMVRRGIELLPDESVKISPSKLRLVRRAVAKSRARVLLPFSMGEKLKGDEGSMNRLSEKIFLKDRIAEHNSGGKHLELHEPVCLGYQYGDGVVYGCYSTPFLLENAMCSVNSQWGVHFGFDTTFGISNKNFELMGICANSLGRKSNPICLAIVNRESEQAYEKMYTATQGASGGKRM